MQNIREVNRADEITRIGLIIHRQLIKTLDTLIIKVNASRLESMYSGDKEYPADTYTKKVLNKQVKEWNEEERKHREEFVGDIEEYDNESDMYGIYYLNSNGHYKYERKVGFYYSLYQGIFGIDA